MTDPRTPQQPFGALRMHATARLRTELAPDGRGGQRTRLAALRSEAPLKLRPTIASAPEPWAAHADDFARVCLAAAAAGPVGGDRLHLDIQVAAGSSLVLTEASATLLLPGHDGAESVLEIHATVEEGGTLVWLPEPVIAARGSHHTTLVNVALAPDARLLLREELILGRKGEPSGHLRQRVRVRRDGRPLHAQDLTLGLDHSPAVTGGHGAVGSLLVVDPELGRREVCLLSEDGVLLPLAGDGAVLVNALAADSGALRRQLDSGLATLGHPWDPRAPRAAVQPDRVSSRPTEEVR